MAAVVTVFACGEPLAGDDAAGPLAVEGLGQLFAGTAAVRVVHELSIDELMALPPQARIVIVDAVVGVPAGRLVRLDLADLNEHATRVRAWSTHHLPLHQAVGLALLFGATFEGVFLGVGGASFVPGEGPSPAVRQALPALRASIIEAVRRLASALQTAGPDRGVPVPSLLDA